jgi:hypothetical protein
MIESKQEMVRPMSESTLEKDRIIENTVFINDLLYDLD